MSNPVSKILLCNGHCTFIFSHVFYSNLHNFLLKFIKDNIRFHNITQYSRQADALRDLAGVLCNQIESGSIERVRVLCYGSERVARPDRQAWKRHHRLSSAAAGKKLTIRSRD